MDEYKSNTKAACRLPMPTAIHISERAKCNKHYATRLICPKDTLFGFNSCANMHTLFSVLTW